MMGALDVGMLVISGGVFAYLLYALIFPEKF
jgi:K+-transporting ATPase KdpF subunit